MSTLTVLIMTPLAMEYEAVSRHLTDKQAFVNEGAAYEKGQFIGKYHTYDVVVREPGMKNTDMALATERAIQHWSPNIAILCGIAGGIKDVKIGDVAVARSAFSYDSGKESQNGFLPRPVEYHFSEELLANAQLVQRSNDWKKRCSDGAPQANVHITSVASGDKVVAAINNDTYDRITQFLSHTKFLEIESAGFGLAIQRYRNVHALVVRGISDLCAGKDDTDQAEENWQERAAERASAVVMEVLDKLFISSFANVTLTPNLANSQKIPSNHSLKHPIKIFISYAQEDATFRDSLTRHLSGLRRSGKVEIWSDNLIEAGMDWNDVTKEHLRQADIIILLLSDNFMASDLIWDTQLKESLSRRDRGEALMLIPILVRSCDLKHTVINKIQGLPRSQKAISLYRDVDEAWFNVVVEIDRLVENFEDILMQASRNAHQTAAESVKHKLGNNNITSEGVILIVDP